MAIRKEKNGTYTVDISLGILNGKRQRIRKQGFKKLKDAQEVESKLRNNKEIEIRQQRIKFKDVYIQYINYCLIEETKGNMRKTTIESKKSIFENHILPIFKNYYITDIHKAEILNFQQKLAGKANNRNSNKQLANETLRKVYKQLNAFFEYCIQEELIYINPCKIVNNYKKEKKEKEFITNEEFELITEKIECKRDKTILTLLFFSGLRISELLGLTLNTLALDIENPYLKIEQTCHKGEIRNYTKTDESKNIVYLDDETRDLLIDYINSDEFKSYNSIYLFPSLLSKCGVLSEKSVNNMIKKYCKEANINKEITCHTFRHSHVALLIYLGHNLQDIKERVRHSSIKTTSDEYGHMYNSRRIGIADDITDFRKNYKNFGQFLVSFTKKRHNSHCVFSICINTLIYI